MRFGPRLRRAAGLIPHALAAIACVHPAARMVARWDWRADLLSHFQEPAFFATLAAVAALTRQHVRLASLFGLLALWQVAPLIRHAGANPVLAARPDAPKLRILMANVLVDNPHYDAMAAILRREKPDVVGLVEYSEEWAGGLADVAREYPYRYDAPDGPRGLALWFREPPVSVDPPRQATPDGWPFLHAVFRFAGVDRHLWLVHPSSPLRRLGEHRGFPELDGLAARVAAVRGSRIVMGDMNTTDGSPHFGDFLATTGLRDSRSGFGRQPSWPVWSPYRIAIDHALVSPDLAVTARALLEPTGSDHLPLLFVASPAAAMAPSAAEAHASPSSP